jgi:hypothetical protein
MVVDDPTKPRLQETVQVSPLFVPVQLGVASGKNGGGPQGAGVQELTIGPHVPLVQVLVGLPTLPGQHIAVYDCPEGVRGNISMGHPPPISMPVGGQSGNGQVVSTMPE